MDTRSDRRIWPTDDHMALTAALQVATGALALIAHDGHGFTLHVQDDETELIPALTLALLQHGAPGVELNLDLPGAW